MAKRFGGFTPEQQQTLLSKMGYNGPAQQDDINKFMMASPKAASMMGRYTQMAKARVEGGPQVAMAAGGYIGVDGKTYSSVRAAEEMGGGMVRYVSSREAAEMAAAANPAPAATQTTSTNAATTTATMAQPTTSTVGTVQPVYGRDREVVAYNVVDASGKAISKQFGGEAAAQQWLNSQTTQPTSTTQPTTTATTATATTEGTVVGKGGKYYIKDAQGNLSQSYNTALDAYYANKGQTTNTSTGATIAPYTAPTSTATTQPATTDVTATVMPATTDVTATVMPAVEPTPYDPTTGLPESPKLQEVNALDFFKQNTGGGYYLPNYNETKLANLVNEGSDLSGATAEGNIVTFADGKTLTTKNPEEAAQVVKAAGAYNKEVVQPNKTAQDQYTQQVEQYKQYQQGQAGASLEDVNASYTAAKTELAQAQNVLNNYTSELAGMAADDPRRAQLEKLIEEQQINITNAQAKAAQARSNLESVGMPSTTELRSTSLSSPEDLVTKADVATFTDEERAAGKIAEGTGQAPATAATATQTEAKYAGDVGQVADIGTVTYDATMVTDKAKAELEKAKEAVGKLSEGSTFEGEQGAVSSESLAPEVNLVAEDRIQKVNEDVNLAVTKDQLAEVKGKDLTAIEAKIAQSDALKDAVAETQQVQPEELPPPAQIAEDQMAQAKAMQDAGLVPDAVPVAAKLAAFTVDDGTLAKAMEGEVGALATVEGQLSQLMKDFDDGTPAWAAGAIRAANAAMSARGLGASSMAAAAILQAAMESALPIAQQDAQTFANMGLQNLNNRQQVALTNAAAQQGLQLQNLSNEQQANLQKSAQAFALQEANLSNRQAAEIANAQIRATLQGQNLTNQQQSNIAIAARFAEAANINLNNKQQAAMQTNANQLQTNLANLSSKSQAYITNANLAASLQGQVLSNEQQVAIQNAARFSEAANITFTTQQQNALHNSKLMETIGLAELSANMAATLQNAATYASMDMANLNNRQQAAVQNAKAFLEMDMANLSNEQQMAMFKAQATQQALLSDQAAENAAKQFNASSENQTNQFMANLNTQINLANQEQQNAMNKFNAGEANAISIANANAQNARDQFNASSELVIAQANAQWEQTISTTENAAQNAANRDAAAAANGLTETTYNNMLQQERDALDYAVKIADREDQQEHALLLNNINNDAAASAAKGSAVGSIVATVGSLLLKKAFA